MSDKRSALLFYRSYFDSIELLKPRAQLELYRTICRYGLDGIEPTTLSKSVAPVWKSIQPNVDSSIKKRADGSKGGRPPKTTGYEDNKTTGYANAESNMDMDKDKDRDRDKGIGAKPTAVPKLSKSKKQVCQSLPDSAERIGYAETEELKKQFRQQISTETATPASVPLDTDQAIMEAPREDSPE